MGLRDQEIADILAEQKREVLEAEQAILAHLDAHGDDYSRGIRDALGLKLYMAKIVNILNGLEERGVLVSELRMPPHPGPRGRGMARRYYRRAP